MNRSWVRFPQAAQKRPPLQGWVLLLLKSLLIFGFQEHLVDGASYESELTRVYML